LSGKRAGSGVRERGVASEEKAEFQMFVQGAAGARRYGVRGGFEAGFRDFEVAHPDRGVLTQRGLDEVEAETAAQGIAQA
jgi:hypothetical protein